MMLKTIDSYRANIRNAVRGLWNGAIIYIEFYQMMQQAIEYGFTQAWREGALVYGIQPSELSEEELNRLQSEINKEIGFLNPLADAIMANSRANRGKLRPLYARAELWVSGYNRVRVLAGSYAAKDQKQEWLLGPTKEHCPDCSMYNGRVYRASVWRKHNIQPRMYELNCHGYHCECEFAITNKPANKGFPPSPRG